MAITRIVGCILGYELHPGKRLWLVFRQGRAASLGWAGLNAATTAVRITGS